MTDFLTSWAGSVWSMLLDSALLLWLGLFLAGFIHLFLNQKTINRYLKKGGRSDVFMAALIGVPLPLCSCSVLPVARELGKSGVKRGAVSSFLISTPETGVDSIMLTYSLTDPLLTVARPITAFLTAVTAGLWEHSSNTTNNPGNIQADEADACCGCGPDNEVKTQSKTNKLFVAIKYAITDLLADLSPYLLIGYLLAGLVTVVLGDSMVGLSDSLKTGWAGYLGAIIIGLPLYICATSSTPMAAALLAIGFSPGAILVFLMVGPATNVASLVVVSKILNGRSLVRYLISIVGVSILCGLVLDWIYKAWSITSRVDLGQAHHSDSLSQALAAVLLTAGIFYFVGRDLIRRVNK